MSSELNLFYETIEEIKDSKTFSPGGDTWASSFELITNTGLLNPTFYIYEIFGGERLVYDVVFDRFEQKFYIKEIDEMLSKAEVIQYVKRCLICWDVGWDVVDHGVGGNFKKLKEYYQSKGSAESIKTLNRILELSKSAQTQPIDLLIELRENPPTNELQLEELNKKYQRSLEEIRSQIEGYFLKLKELNPELTKEPGLLTKLLGLFY